MSTEGTNSPPTKSPKRDEDFCLIIPLPKVVFFYPTMLACLICWVMSPQVEQDIIGKSLYIGYYEQATVVEVLGETANQEQRPDWSDRDTRQTWQQVAEKTNALSRDGGAKPGNAAGWIFLIVFTINILVVAFDFPGIKALAVAFFLVAGTFGGLYFNVQYNIIEPLKDLFLQVSPFATQDFYLFIAILLGVVIGLSMFVNRFWNKWTLTPISLIHKHGMLGNVKEYRAINMQVTKVIPDIFEWVLLLSGTLIFKVPNEPEPIRLENVMLINPKENKIKRILSKAFSSD